METTTGTFAARHAFQLDGKYAVNEKGQVYNRVSGEVVPQEEPLFMLRARDILALGTLSDYAVRAVNDNCTDIHLEGIDATIRQFEKFRRQFSERMKQPGNSRGKPIRATQTL